MSCTPCSRLYFGTIQFSETKTHHPGIASLCRSALSGCRICTDLWRHFFKEKTPEEYAEDPFFVGQRTVQVYAHSGTRYSFCEARPGLAPGSLELEFSLSSPMIKGVERKRFVFERLEWGERRFAYEGNVSLTQTNSGYMNMLEITPKELEAVRWRRVHSWIDRCNSSHTICKLRCSTSGFFPSRVLYVPFSPMAAEARYHLIDTRIHSPSSLGSRYVTLSHCWGEPKDPPYRTTANNIAERLRTGIAADELPPTFKDAIDTARKLRIPFLWIDSLCIIQEDEDDWAIECTKMADVYVKSFLNISATSASSSQDGLSSSYELHPRIVQTGWANGRAGEYRLIDPDFWRERVTDAEINTRGWVLQERVLAPRVLHFGFDQVLWECCELSAAEEFPEGMSSTYTGDYVGGQLDFKQATNLFLAHGQLTLYDVVDSTYRKFHDIWRRLGGMYGRCDLTVPDKDKLMAISGLARVIQRELDDQYLAGLWKKNLVGELLWQVHKTQRRIQGTVPDGLYEKRWDFSKRSKRYRAPSWSWASVDGLVQLGSYLDLSGKPESIEEGDSAFTIATSAMASILDVSTSLINPEDQYGQVNGGKLLIRGQMHRLGLVREKSYMQPTMTFQATGQMAFDEIDEPISWDLYDQAYFLPLVLTEKRFTKLPQSLIDLNKEMREVQLSIRKNEEEAGVEYTRSFTDWESDREDQYDTVAGIEICPTPDRKAWRRIGHMSIQLERFRSLKGCMQLEELNSKNEIPKKDNMCRPDAAAMQGNIVTGIFRIV
ncbi:HET-domain-containing protein [Hyaloscypha variabilis F]|uniref:HET-domain-containing protein n=1 Tax=Hyaloscypha variabilis (strain UAMH 11265 / GT02V1 / F) TaxID=1149755 RepID=A0A2J6R544_HYAVF|nr:HET-domain-containing protein [Hyaloscypha variabilis F]